MQTFDIYTGKSYDVTYVSDDDETGGVLRLAHDGDVKAAIVPPWCADLATEAHFNGDVVLAEAIIKELRPC